MISDTDKTRSNSANYRFDCSSIHVIARTTLMKKKKAELTLKVEKKNRFYLFPSQSKKRGAILYLFKRIKAKKRKEKENPFSFKLSVFPFPN